MTHKKATLGKFLEKILVPSICAYEPFRGLCYYFIIDLCVQRSVHFNGLLCLGLDVDNLHIVTTLTFKQQSWHHPFLCPSHLYSQHSGHTDPFIEKDKLYRLIKAVTRHGKDPLYPKSKFVINRDVVPKS